MGVEGVGNGLNMDVEKWIEWISYPDFVEQHIESRPT
jgi:hypothetical protein